MDLRMKNKKNEKRDKYLNLAWELKKTMEPKGSGGTNCNLGYLNDLQRRG